MTCQELTAFLDSYLDGTLPPSTRADFDLHLAECEACVDFLDGYRLSISLGRASLGAPSDPVPPKVPDDLVNAILAARRKP